MSYNPKIKNQQNGQIAISGNIIVHGTNSVAANTITCNSLTCSVLSNSALSMSFYDYNAVNGFKTNITRTSNNLTLSASHHIIFAEPTSAHITINLPKAANHTGRQYVLKKNLSSSYSASIVAYNAVELVDDGNGGFSNLIVADVVESSSSISLTSSYQSVRIVSDGTGSWYII